MRSLDKLRQRDDRIYYPAHGAGGDQAAAICAAPGRPPDAARAADQRHRRRSGRAPSARSSPPPIRGSIRGWSPRRAARSSRTCWTLSGAGSFSGRRTDGQPRRSRHPFPFRLAAAGVARDACDRRRARRRRLSAGEIFGPAGSGRRSRRPSSTGSSSRFARTATASKSIACRAASRPSARRPAALAASCRAQMTVKQPWSVAYFVNMRRARPRRL